MCPNLRYPTTNYLSLSPVGECAGVVSYHYQRCLESPRMKPEETAPESPRHLLTSTVGGRQTGAGHDEVARSVNL